MMPTEKVLEIQNWYIRALEYASQFSYLPVQRKMYYDDMTLALDEFKTTYGEDMPCIVNR